MKSKGLMVAAVAALGLVLTGLGAGANGATRPKPNYKATLTATQEVPRPSGKVALARGTFLAVLKIQKGQRKLSWSLSYRRLTGRPLAAHIHFGKRGTAGEIAVPLCTRCGLSAGGLAFVSAKVASAMRTGNAYVNIHTLKNPKGEIRGQIKFIG